MNLPTTFDEAKAIAAKAGPALAYEPIIATYGLTTYASFTFHSIIWHYRLRLRDLDEASCADCPDMLIQRQLRRAIEGRMTVLGYTDFKVTRVSFHEDDFMGYVDTIEVSARIEFLEVTVVGA